MNPQLRRLTVAQFASVLTEAMPNLSREIAAVHLHHTWRPTRSQFKGLATIEAMRNFHINTNGWDDIAQHLTIDPQGFLWTGRNWNLPPASQTGKNGTRQRGPFMIETVGDFDAGRDVLDGDQRQAVVEAVAALLRERGLGIADVLFHRELGSPKTCPGSGLDKQALLDEIQAALTRPAPAAALRSRRKTSARRAAKGSRGVPAVPFAREFVLGVDVSADVGEAAEGYDSWEVPEGELAARVMGDEASARVRASLNQPSDFASVLDRATRDWEVLRPHVVNLTKGRLSQSGQFQMPHGSIEAIIEAIERYARATDNPRVMLHAHGGLVGETSALNYALEAHRWWLAHDVFPVYFVWETSVFDVIRNRLGIGRGIGDFFDRRFERFVRPIGKPLWSDMKEYALLSSSTDAGDGEAGGAWIFAQALSALVKNPPLGKPIMLHTVGHSAGAIFQCHFVPTLNGFGVPVESLAFLAPANRIDLFKQMLVPRLSSGELKQFAMYTMDEEAERDDDLIEVVGVPFYGKSLLYLISGAFEPEVNAGIMGLQERCREDADIIKLFPPDGRHRLELSHAKGKPHNPATKSRKHGCFDNDDATLRSVIQTILGTSTDVEFPVKDSACVKASSRAFQVIPTMGGMVGSAPGAFFTVGDRSSNRRTGVRRALCVGIDNYPTSPLTGCVRDAQAWARVLRDVGFEVGMLIDAEATRQRVLDALGALVTSARPDEALVFAYAGHGTQADDLGGDESDRYDEALVPVDYASGALLLDDDLAEVYRRLPEGVTLTLFMDCCNSGTNSRFAPLDRRDGGDQVRRRFLPLTPELQELHRRYRARAGSPRPTSPEESLPGLIHFAACLDNQFAYESGGHGHFTRAATESLASAVSRGASNEDFNNDVAAKVIALGRPQTPRLMRLPEPLMGRPLLGGVRAGGSGFGDTAPVGALTPTDRAMDEWCLQFFEAGAAHWRQRLGR